MPRIKVTGYIELEPGEEDSNHQMGLTEEAHLKYSDMFPLDSITFEPVFGEGR